MPCILHSENKWERACKTRLNVIFLENEEKIWNFNTKKSGVIKKTVWTSKLTSLLCEMSSHKKSYMKNSKNVLLTSFLLNPWYD